MAESIVVTVGGVVERASIPVLCERLRGLLAAGDADGGAVICDVGRLATADMVAVAALLRLQLTARRLGRRLWLRHASAELQAMLRWTGFAELLPLEPGLSGQARRQVEQREEARGIQEEGDAADPPVR